MSTQETQKIEALEKKMSEISIAISGNEGLGIPGLVNMLQSHMENSDKNNAQIQEMFKEFKRQVVYDYANNFNRVESSIGTLNEGYFKLNKKVDDAAGKQAKVFGIFSGLGAIIGFALAFIWEKIKAFL